MELQNNMAEETKRADKAEFKLKRIQEKLSTVTREKEVMINSTLKCLNIFNQFI